MAEARITFERQPNGTYRAWTSTDGFQSVNWDPRRGRQAVLAATWSYGSGEVFRREATEMIRSFGRACRSCSYLELEHNIDGEEKAPCRMFV